MQKQSSAKGWIVTFSGTGINLALGALYSWSLFKKPLENAFGLNDKQTALPYSIAIVLFALMMVPAGRLQDRFGPRIIASVGGIMVGLGFFLSGLAAPGNAIILLVLGFGVLAGAGIGFAYASASPPAIKWFPASKKGLIVGLVVGGFGLASVYVAPLTDNLIKSRAPKPAVVASAPAATAAAPAAGKTAKPVVTPEQARMFSGATSFAFKTLAVIFTIAVLFFSQFLKNPPKGYIPGGVPAAPKAGAPVTSDFNWNEMLKTKQFYLIWLMFMFGSSSGLMVISFMGKMAKELNDAGKIAFAGFIFVAILAIGNAGGRIIAGTLSDKIGRTRTMLLVFSLQAIILLLFPTFNSTVVFVIGALIIGFDYGACLSLFPSITSDYYGMKNFGLNYGIIFSAWGVGGFCMPILAGAIKDATGSYTNAFYVAAVMCVIAALTSFIVKPPAHAPVAKS
jgi:OFA family oxalate/formate antiporter-like MFS transporter